MSDTELISGEDQIREVIADYRTRLAKGRERYDAYHPDCQRRYFSDEHYNVERRMVSATKYITGEYDRTYAGPHPSFGETLADFRLHYADDCLRDALHSLLWAEYYAGTRTRESARELDPFNAPRK